MNHEGCILTIKRRYAYIKYQHIKMRLKDKFYKAINIFSTSNNRPEICEEIADEHAIQFARYVASNPKIFNNGSSMEQALSLFKIENNL
jgi:hypothetical protein